MPKVPPPVYVVVGLVAQHLLSRGRRPTVVRSVGAGLVAAGSVYLAGSAARAFKHKDTTFNPLEPERATAVVTDGPFRYTRNPMYVGMAGLLAAHAVYRGGLVSFVPVAAFVAVIDRTQIPAEERALAMGFGEAYEAYRGVTPRWVGLRG
ncbi:isoprenylcysteine carboxylmethyltransferase family protein [Nocardioides sp. KC13]|uniref:Isoprenylcysteine carboxylmethyltransferase family protein n=1 Tax=Nocardioides turkmenicus TaxID=2711220 RepID=A0A6M1QWV3_9ACTN|nr:isoprenylcysteine carboxylmethyltransferase family protein [Nocardioides sp. KC13]NGN94435.1 isoprenylcysteine carboxylmethyltransferase family protein [Nocardioides sp. KC13]